MRDEYYDHRYDRDDDLLSRSPYNYDYSHSGPSHNEGFHRVMQDYPVKRYPRGSQDPGQKEEECNWGCFFLFKLGQLGG